MMKTTIPSILGIQYPLVQAPMNWINNAAMIAAVSNAGALGVLGPNAGQKSENGRRIGTEERVGRVLEQINGLTDKPYGINIISASDEATRAYAIKNIAAARNAGVRIYAVVGAYDPVIFGEIKKAGGLIMHRDLNPTPQSAHISESEGADIIVATGHDEGGMLPDKHIGTFTIVPQIADAVSIPVIAAGGINDIRGVRAAFALGAQGVYVGSRFAVSCECPASQAAKQAIIDADGTDLIYVDANERSLPTDYAMQLNKRLVSGEDTKTIAADIHRNGGLRPAMYEGNLNSGIISVNTGIGIIRSELTCAEIVRSLMADFMQQPQS